MSLRERAVGSPRRVRVYRLTGTLVTMSIIYAIGGCAPNDPGPFYSGDFFVLSKNEKAIVIKDWAGFGMARPPQGYVDMGKGMSADGPETHFPRLDFFPESTVVTWVLEDDQEGEVFSQEINLKGIVPQNTEGQTEFIFDENGVWTVRFVGAVE
ncbi:MAG: hypothetical protein KF777_10995 [Planctomycetaceae bacterium]|nr:hypothetical protein [Planctomycetaceae bacterium]